MNNALNIHIEGHGYPLVFFHGWGFDSRIWQSLSNALKLTFRVYLVDLPGFGGSDCMDWFEFKAQLLSRLPSQFAVNGWSMGGLYAMRLAIEVPERVSHLIVTASTPRFITDFNWPGVQEDVFDGFFNQLQVNPQDTIADFIRIQLPQSKSSGVLSAGRPKLNMQGLTQGLDTLANWDLREGLSSYVGPASFIFGRLDAITPKSTMDIMQAHYPQFNYLLFKKAAHMPFLSHESDYLNHIKAFLS